MPANTLKDHKAEQRIVGTRVWLALFIMIVLVFVLIARLFYLQVLRYDEMSTQSEENRVLLQTIPPVRGLIYDTHGKLLAMNRSSRSLTIVRELAGDLDQLIADISTLVPITDNERRRFDQRIRRRRPFEPIPLKFNLDDEQIATVAVNQFRLPGVEIDADLVRYYPEGSIFAHSVGYVGRINDRELRTLDPALYSGTYVTGKIGLEKYYESILLGKPGYQEVETNARGRVLRILNQVPPEPGKDLELYLDTELQKVAIEALDGRRGAVVAMDPKTGGVLSMVSNPSFDPNLFVTGIDFESFDGLNKNIERPLYNRATLGEYPPASTIKPVIGLALLANDVVDKNTKIFDQGWFQLPGSDHRFRNWNRRGDGWVNLYQAMVRSNDTFFYKQAGELGIDRMHDFLSQFGLGRRTGIDIGEERPGLLPSREWKRGAYGQPWYPGETVIAIIGQGYNLATPLQLAEFTTILANRGKHVQPRLVKEDMPEIQSPEWGQDVDVRDEDWDLIIDSMEDVIKSPRGTAHWRIGRNLKYRIAGKTGTAQVVSIPQGEEYDAERLKEFERDHSLFVAFAPVEDPQIAISVIVENSGGAANVAKTVMDHYLLPRLNPSLTHGLSVDEALKAKVTN
ncbi:penicillin-binding protein 2 [Endozoicomonas montiporae]|uniref:Peptidoglycan D,D-transpeptidase MrdA n=1 Tax=Endozoicomonas montiporae CL-33 TaxID=570277 RepID=A0A142B8R6_9GAMM|nr:penicillin-binding protein 2 [Endozoicomonas montiporae]AMO55142.1 peptidoglycan glycosyltransferase [Endozoicomonas montiporae CL-33]